MNFLAWWRSSRPAVKPNPHQEDEKRHLKAQLAHTVMTFERDRYTVDNIAKRAVQSMRQGEQR